LEGDGIEPKVTVGARDFSILVLPSGDGASRLLRHPGNEDPFAGDPEEKKAIKPSGFCNEQNRKCCRPAMGFA
jgi:hypothetical protein